MEKSKIKYLLIKNNIIDGYTGYPWKGYVVKYISTNNKYYQVQVLCDFPPVITFTENDNTIYLAERHINDITEIYDKMVKLLKKINGGAGAYGVSKIIKSFKEGIFPPKSDFNYMNTLWKAIRNNA